MGTYGTLNFQVYFVISLGRLFVTFANRQGHQARGPKRIHPGGTTGSPDVVCVNILIFTYTKWDESSKLP